MANMEECAICGEEFECDIERDVFAGETGEPICSECKAEEKEVIYSD